MSYKKENSRADRMHNIAVAFIEIYPLYKGQAMLTSKFREFIISKIKIDRTGWDKEKILGDYRANGDAIGGHGLKLDIQTLDGRSYVKFSNNNLTKVSTYSHLPQNTKKVPHLIRITEDEDNKNEDIRGFFMRLCKPSKEELAHFDALLSTVRKDVIKLMKQREKNDGDWLLASGGRP